MVNRKSQIGTLEAWRGGLKLREALELFPPQLDRAALAKEAKAQRRNSAIGKQKFREVGVNADQLLDGLGTGLLRLSAAVQIGEAQKAQLIKALKRGELLALGNPSHRPKAPWPEPIPEFLIQLEFANFAKSEFSDGDCRYVHVRIVPGKAVDKPRTGRPSAGNKIMEIASALAKANEIQRTMPPKVQAGKIREYGERHFPDDFTKNSPTDQTIQRHLKTFWNSN
jgi:hypothetical protein